MILAAPSAARYRFPICMTRGGRRIFSSLKKRALRRRRRRIGRVFRRCPSVMGDFSDVCPYVPQGSTVGFNTAQYPDCPSEVGQSSNHVTFPGNQIGQYVSPVYRALMDTGIIPAPTATSGCNSSIGSCYNGEVSLPSYWRQELFRIDQSLSANAQANFRYIHDEYSNTVPVPQYGYTQNSFPTIQNRVYGPGLSMVAQFSYAASPSLIHNVNVGYTDSLITFANLPGSAVSLTRPAEIDGSSGLLPIFANGYGNKLPGIAISGNNAVYGGFGFAVDPGYMPWSHTNPIYSVTENTAWNWRKHAMQMGAQWVIFQRNQINGPIGAADRRYAGTADLQQPAVGVFDWQCLCGLCGVRHVWLRWAASFQQDSSQAKVLPALSDP